MVWIEFLICIALIGLALLGIHLANSGVLFRHGD